LRHAPPSPADTRTGQRAATVRTPATQHPDRISVVAPRRQRAEHAQTETVPQRRRAPLCGIRALVGDNRVGLVTDDRTGTEQTVEQVDVFGRLAGRPGAEPLVESAEALEPITLDGCIRPRADGPRKEASAMHGPHAPGE